VVEIAVLQQAKPEKVLVVYWDSKFLGAEEFTPDDLEFTIHTDKGGAGPPRNACSTTSPSKTSNPWRW
jgi:hypothetical protein